MTNLEVSIVNAILYVSFFCFWIWKSKGLTISTFVLFLYAICAVISIFFVSHPFFMVSFHATKLTLIPYLYLFVVFLIFFYPLSILKENNIELIKAPPKNQLNILLIYLSVILSVTLILHLPYVLEYIQNPTELIENKIARDEGDNVIKFSTPWSTIVLLGKIASDMSILFFFYILTLDSINKRIKILFGFIVLTVNPALAIAMGSRASLVFFIFNIFFSYTLFKKFYNRKMKKVISILSILFFTFFIVFIMIITINRFSETDNGLNFYILKYFGESYSNFNGILFEKIKNYTNGVRNFSFITNLIGITDLKDITELRYYSDNITGIPNHYFYLFIGQIYIDFGPILTTLLAVFSFFYFKKKFRQHENIPFHTLIIFFIYFNMLSRGIFFYPYSDKSGNLTLIFSLFIYIIMRFNFKRDSFFVK